jgi:hypothetical protein
LIWARSDEKSEWRWGEQAGRWEGDGGRESFPFQVLFHRCPLSTRLEYLTHTRHHITMAHGPWTFCYTCHTAKSESIAIAGVTLCPCMIATAARPKANSDDLRSFLPISTGIMLEFRLNLAGLRWVYINEKCVGVSELLRARWPYTGWLARNAFETPTIQIAGSYTGWPGKIRVWPL